MAVCTVVSLLEMPYMQHNGSGQPCTCTKLHVYEMCVLSFGHAHTDRLSPNGLDLDKRAGRIEHEICVCGRLPKMSIRPTLIPYAHFTLAYTRCNYYTCLHTRCKCKCTVLASPLPLAPGQLWYT